MTFKALICILIAFMIGLPASAGTTVQKRFSDWHFIRHTFTNGDFSCQSLQCEQGMCESRDKSFLLVATKTLKYVIPEFNAGVMAPVGAKAVLTIGGQQFQLVQDAKKPVRFFRPLNRRDLENINTALTKLSAHQSNSAFHVVDHRGFTRNFTARGADKAFAETALKCNSDMPRQ